MTLSNSFVFSAALSPLVGSRIHSGGRARFHLAGFSLSGLHFEIGSARSHIAFARRGGIALNLQHRGTGSDRKLYRLEVFTPETSPKLDPPPCAAFARGFSLSSHRWN